MSQLIVLLVHLIMFMDHVPLILASSALKDSIVMVQNQEPNVAVAIFVHLVQMLILVPILLWKPPLVILVVMVSQQKLIVNQVLIKMVQPQVAASLVKPLNNALTLVWMQEQLVLMAPIAQLLALLLPKNANMVIIRMLQQKHVLLAQPTISVIVMVLLLVIRIPPTYLIFAQLVTSVPLPHPFNIPILCPLIALTTTCVPKVTGVTLAIHLTSKLLALLVPTEALTWVHNSAIASIVLSVIHVPMMLLVQIVLL